MFIINSSFAQNPTNVSFKSSDGLEVSGHLYEINNTAPVILLCHQARYNKYEYKDIAPKLNKMGFNCLAIDQRSGGELFDQNNETFGRAKKAGKPTEYLDAEKDIVSAINFLTEKYDSKLILWGSSYSSTLAVYLASENENVDAFISFSPGNYFSNQKGDISTKFTEVGKPFFVTSSKKEASGLSKLLDGIELQENQTQFIPKQEGYHGSKALWTNQKGGEEYWKAITEFLHSLK
jgi:alpha-beta hydrolase superfamily lysophospholipase